MSGRIRLTLCLACLGLFAGGGCASSQGPEDFAEVPSAEELYRLGISRLESGHRAWIFDTTDYRRAIDTFQDIIDNYPYSEYSVLAELRIADAYFDQRSYDEALSYYRDFGDLHPDHPRVPYTVYRTALSHYRQSKGASRDQTATKAALTELDRLLRAYPHSAEAAEAETLWKELRTRVGRHVMGIGDFYMEREEYQSAADRYRSVLNEYPGLGLDADALYKLGVCYQEMNLEDQAGRIFQVILDNYQGSEVAKAAEDLVPAAN